MCGWWIRRESAAIVLKKENQDEGKCKYIIKVFIFIFAGYFSSLVISKKNTLLSQEKVAK